MVGAGQRAPWLLAEESAFQQRLPANAAKLTAMKARSRRGLRRWTIRVRSSFAGSTSGFNQDIGIGRKQQWLGALQSLDRCRRTPNKATSSPRRDLAPGTPSLLFESPATKPASPDKPEAPASWPVHRVLQIWHRP